MIASG
jgi:hypothetical protein